MRIRQSHTTQSLIESNEGQQQIFEAV